MKRKYAVLTSGYPSEKKPNVMGFVHSRVRTYIELGIDVDVFLIGKNLNYTFEGVSVISGDINKIRKELDNNYDCILVHFLDKNKIEVLGDKKCIIWVHGFEALSWKRRLFNLNPRIPLYIIDNTSQLYNFKKYAKSHPESKFVFVSKWMYNVTCADIGYKIKNYNIVHNYIDPNIFEYNKKTYNQRKNILLVRSFANKKYANDISVKFIEQLSKKEYFNELDINIYGDGRLFKGLTKKIQNVPNISINNRFLTQYEISNLHKRYGVFLCPTRQDAQGVSMCEAMSSGLVPLTSENTAIPSFVEDGKEGFLCNNNDIETFINAYDFIYENPKEFIKISENASRRIQKQCSIENTILKEVELIESM